MSLSSIRSENYSLELTQLNRIQHAFIMLRPIQFTFCFSCSNGDIHTSYYIVNVFTPEAFKYAQETTDVSV